MINLKDKIPNTILEAIQLLYNGLTASEKEFILGNDAARVHHFTGMAIRNEWGLWNKNSPIVKELQTEYGLFGHGDDCSGLILAGLWAHVRGQDVEKTLAAEADRYYAHWKREGLDPKTGEPIKGFQRKTQSILVGKEGQIIVDEM